MARAIDCGDERRRIAGLVICGSPDNLAGLTIESDQPRTVCSANIQQHTISIHQWRAGGSKESFADPEPLMGI